MKNFLILNGYFHLKYLFFINIIMIIIIFMIFNHNYFYQNPTNYLKNFINLVILSFFCVIKM